MPLSLPSGKQWVAGHYDRLDDPYRRLWGEHLHHGLWTEPSLSVGQAVRGLVRQVAGDARMNPGSRVCDVGCGYGAPARLWAREYGARVTGFTVSGAQYSRARRVAVDGPTPTYRLQDFRSHDLPAASMDAVVGIESLTHIHPPQRVFQEAARLLCPGGRLVLCVWMAAPRVPPWARRRLLDPISEAGRLWGLPTATALHRWATEAGLRVERLDDLTPLVRRTWTVVLRRVARGLFSDPVLRRILADKSHPGHGFARVLPRIWAAQHLGVLRYGWLVAAQRDDGAAGTPAG